MTAHRIIISLSPAEEELLQTIKSARDQMADDLGLLKLTPEQHMAGAAGPLLLDWMVEERRALVRLGYIDPDWMPGENKSIQTAG